MDLTQKIKNALMTSALALSMYACTTNYQPNIEVYRGKDKNYLKMELPDGRVLQDSSRKYMKIEISDSLRYDIDGRKETISMAENQNTEKKSTVGEGILYMTLVTLSMLTLDFRKR